MRPTVWSGVLLCLVLSAARAASDKGPWLTDKELKALGKEIAGYKTTGEPSPALSAAERAALEKTYSRDGFSLGLGPGVTKAHAEGLKRFMAEAPVAVTPFRKLWIGTQDCEAVDSAAARKLPYLVKTFDRERGYLGDWVHVPDGLPGAEQVYGVLRYLHGMSLKTTEELDTPVKKGGATPMDRLAGLARDFPRMRVYALYHFSPKKKRFVNDGVSTFLTGAPEPVAGPAGEARAADLRRGHPVAGPSAGGGPAPRDLAKEEDPEDLCYADFDVEAACQEMSDTDAELEACRTDLSERVDCLCFKVCGEARVRARLKQ